jgi:2-dehydro-3-deoxyphosphogluconate aldolase/(4S)-4-hydroxy-2-oxoglutarate aldolase
MNRAFLEGKPVVGILRGFQLAQIQPIIEAAIVGGLRNVEITMSSENAEAQIAETARLAQGKLNIGAGTVLDVGSLTRALGAGASFIVTPTLQRDVIAECVRLGISVFSGAFSPTEVIEAWELGAAMVKIFPAEILGAGYIKALKAPLAQVKLMPTGGVDLQTLPGYLRAGADGFGVGNPLFDRTRIGRGDWKWLAEQCRAFVKATQS